MDNQQERLALIGYLAGIVDGEGCVGLFKKPDGHFRPSVAIHMVGIEAVDELDRICKILNLPSYVLHLKDSSRWSIVGLKRVGRFLRVIGPHMRIKKKQAELLLEYVDDRLALTTYKRPESDRAIEIQKEISSLNMKGKNPQRLYAEARRAGKI